MHSAAKYPLDTEMVSHEALVQDSHSAPWTEPSVLTGQKLRRDQCLHLPRRDWNPNLRNKEINNIHISTANIDSSGQEIVRKGKENKEATTSFFFLQLVGLYFLAP